jgi:hypothetical protein
MDRKRIFIVMMLILALVFSLWTMGLFPSSATARQDKTLQHTPQSKKQHVNDYRPYLKNIHEWQKRYCYI